MAIQVRRGNYDRYDPTRLTAGEWAVVLSGDPNVDDGMGVYICFAAGTVKRMATFEDMVANIMTATEQIREQLTEGVEQATEDAEAATSAANSAASAANTAAGNATNAAGAANTAANTATAAAGAANAAASTATTAAGTANTAAANADTARGSVQQAISDAEDATEAANAAAGSVSTAITNAEAATNQASAAATEATNAAGTATAAAGAATTAAGTASDAASTATSAANAASSAAADASAAASTATTAAGTANTAAESATSAASTATSAAGAATSAASTATNAAQEARSAASAADTATSNANSAEETRRSNESAREQAERERNEAQQQNNEDQELNNEMAARQVFVDLASGEYDATTLQPTILGPRDGVIYVVPTTPRVQWRYNGTDYEPIGASDGTLNPITTADVDDVVDDEGPTGNRVLSLTTLSYLWTKLKANFAALVNGVVAVSQGGTGKATHTSNAIITGNGTGAVKNISTKSGALYATATNGAATFDTLPVAQGGTGGTDAATARTNLDAAQSNGASGTLKSAETEIDNLESSLAYVESTTARTNHAAGDYFMLGNVLMRATTAIATGEQITASKATPVTIQSQIDTLRDSVYQPMTFTPNSAQCTLTRFSGCALSDGSHGQFNMEIATTVNTTTWLGQISIHPPTEECCLVFVFDPNTAASDRWRYGWVRVDGSVSTLVNAAASRVMIACIW